MTVNVLMLSPGFPAEMPHFTRGLAEVGARVFGLGDQPRAPCPPRRAPRLTDYRQVRSLWDDDAVVDEVRAVAGRARARPRRVPVGAGHGGGRRASARRSACRAWASRPSVAFRDKERMKQVLDAAGVRTPRHARATHRGRVPRGGRAHRLPAHRQAHRRRRLGRHLPPPGRGRVRQGAAPAAPRARGERRGVHRRRGVHLRHDLRRTARSSSTTSPGTGPSRSSMRQNPWISPSLDRAAGHRHAGDPDRRRPRPPGPRGPGLRVGLHAHGVVPHARGRGGVRRDRRARSRAAGSTHAMNYSSDIDLFRGWAEAVCHGRLTQDVEKRYNVGVVFKRAEGEGRIQRIDGLEQPAGALRRAHRPPRPRPGRGAAPRLPPGRRGRRLDRRAPPRPRDDDRHHRPRGDRPEDVRRLMRDLHGTKTVLLGPQRHEPTVRAALERLGLGAGPVAAITAGWEEREAEDLELGEHLSAAGREPGSAGAGRGRLPGRPGPLRGPPRAARPHARAAAPLPGAPALPGAGRRGAAAPRGPRRTCWSPSGRPPWTSCATSTSTTSARVRDLEADLREQLAACATRPDLAGTVAGSRRADRAAPRRCCIAGGHVGILYNRLWLFDVLRRSLPRDDADRRVVGRRDGARRARRAVPRHAPRRGAATPRCSGPASGSAAAWCRCRTPRRRLQLDDPVRVQMLLAGASPTRSAWPSTRAPSSSWDGQGWTRLRDDAPPRHGTATWRRSGRPEEPDR